MYLRHSDKLYDNGKSYLEPFDPPLTLDGQQLAYDAAAQYTQESLPSIIYSSPYLRTRQTASILKLAIFQLYEVDVPIKIDPTIGEYLGNHQIYDLVSAFTQETRLYQPAVNETFSQFEHRVIDHFDTINYSCWYITHGLFISTLASYLGCKISRPTSVSGIKISENQTLTPIKYKKMKRQSGSARWHQ